MRFVQIKKRSVEISAYPEPPVRIVAEAGSVVIKQLKIFEAEWINADKIVIPLEKVIPVIEKLKEALEEATTMYKDRNKHKKFESDVLEGLESDASPTLF